jgi:WD40 repeat protein
LADIFISYSSKDREDLKGFLKKLTALGYSIWYDQHLVGGQNYTSEIKERLTQAKACIVIWSENSIDSDWVWEEAEIAGTQGKLLPVRTKDLDPSKIPMPYKRIQTNIVDGMENIARALTSLGVFPLEPHAAFSRAIGVHEPGIRFFGSLDGHTDTVRSLAFHSEKPYLFSASSDGTVGQWDYNHRHLLKKYRGHTDKVNTISLSNKHGKVLSGGRDQYMRIWDIDASRCQVLDGHKDWVKAVHVNDERDRFVSCGHDGKVLVWPLLAGGLRLELGRHNTKVNDAIFSPCGSVVASCDNNGHIKIFDTEKRSELRVIEGHQKPVETLAFLGDRYSLLSAGKDTNIVLWDVQDSSIKAVFRGHKETVRALAVSPDKKVLASGGEDNMVKIWCLESGEQRADLIAHAGTIRALAFSADGKFLASGGADNAVKLWRFE